MATLESSLLASEIVRFLGASSLQEAVTNTLAAREHWNLPDRFVMLYDHQDGGVILLDTCTDLQTGQNKVYIRTFVQETGDASRRKAGRGGSLRGSVRPDVGCCPFAQQRLPGWPRLSVDRG